MSAITLQGVSKSFRSKAYPDGLLVLDKINCSVAENEFVCLLGPSGCGKSTILNMLAGLDMNYDGQLTIDSISLNNVDRKKSNRIGFVFQEPRLLPWLSVRKNVYFALESIGFSSNEWKDITEFWLERVGLHGFADSHPHELSGGMQQRAAIARAFAVDPGILLMDEPFSGLDELTARSMREQMLELWEQSRKTVIFVTHNCFEAAYLADRILIFSGRPGRVVQNIEVEFPRPRDFDSTQLFELSVVLKNHLVNKTESIKLS